MTAVTLERHGHRLPRLTLDRVQAACVWLMMVSSFFVIVEPAPVDAMFAVTVVAFLAGGLRITVIVAPMVLYLLLYNLGGLTSLINVWGADKALMFVVTSAYMAVSAVFFAFFIAADTERRMALFKTAYIIGAVIAAVIALVGYFNVGGLGHILSPIERAQGTFKDPNVLSTYLILPAIFLTQDVMLGTRGRALIRHASLLVILAALFLAFSRGAWINFAAAVTLMVMFTYTLTPSPQLRSRILLLAIAGIVVIAVLLMGLLSIDTVRHLFFDRLTFEKSYDAGELGRFGNQVNSIPLLFERPLGFGPNQFGFIFGLAPHNVFLNAFASYGWLGGISYLLLVVSSIAVGFRGMLMRSPWQNASIAVFCAFFSTALQGVQIDTDHWRHFYWMLGLVWGLYAASVAYQRGMAHQGHMAHQG